MASSDGIPERFDARVRKMERQESAVEEDIEDGRAATVLRGWLRFPVLETSIALSRLRPIAEARSQYRKHEMFKRCPFTLIRDRQDLNGQSMAH